MYLQLPLQQWGAGNVYLLVLSSLKVNIAKNPIAIMGLQIRSGHVILKQMLATFTAYPITILRLSWQSNIAMPTTIPTLHAAAVMNQMSKYVITLMQQNKSKTHFALFCKVTGNHNNILPNM